MTNATFPFVNMDIAKAMSDFDPAKIIDQFTEATKNLTFPQLDLDVFIAAQHKNIEAMTKAKRLAADGVQALTTRQSEILQKSLTQATEAVSEIAKLDSPQDITVKQAELTKVAFEAALSNLKELTELAASLNADTAQAIYARISEFLDEIKKPSRGTKKQSK